MSNFEDFFSDYEDKHNCSPEKYECFEAGQQSKQAEVDELKRKLNEIVILVRDNTPDYYLDNMIDEILKGENHES